MLSLAADPPDTLDPVTFDRMGPSEVGSPAAVLDLSHCGCCSEHGICRGFLPY